MFVNQNYEPAQNNFLMGKTARCTGPNWGGTGLNSPRDVEKKGYSAESLKQGAHPKPTELVMGNPLNRNPRARNIDVKKGKNLKNSAGLRKNKIFHNK